MTPGERIKREREAMKLSRPALARATGIPYPTLAGIENGDQSSSTRLHAIAAALNVTPAWLETGRPPKRLNDLEAEGHPSPAPVEKSHLATPDPDILHEALHLLSHDEGQAGRYSPRAQAARLSDLYARVAADGGRLTKAHNDEFDLEVSQRAQGKAIETGKPHRTRTRRRSNE